MLSANLYNRGMRFHCLPLVTGCLLTATASSSAATYSSFLSIADIRSANNFTHASTHTFDGSTGFFILRGIESDITPTWDSEISKVVDVGGAGQTRTTLVSTADWLSYTGETLMAPGSRAKVLGSSLQFLDQTTDSIYRADTTTGALTTLVSSSDILALTGLTELQVREENAFDSAGNMYFYEDRSDQILMVDTAGSLSVFASKATLQTAVADASLVSYVSGGMAFDADDNLFWTLSGVSSAPGDVSRGSIYKRDNTGVFSKALTQPEVVNVAKTDPFFGANYAAFNDMIFGTDGLLYNYERGNDSMLRFDPEDPANTLELVFERSELLAGPMTTENINSFGVFGYELTWTGFTAHDGVFNYTMPPLEGDLNGDGFVGLADLDIILNNWNLNVPPADPASDPTGDGFVGLADLDEVLNNWNAGTPPVSAVPEPTTTVIAGIAGLALLNRRR